MSDDPNKPKGPKVGAIKRLLSGSKKLAGRVVGEEAMGTLERTTLSMIGFATDGLKNVSAGTVEATVRRFNEALPYIERAGFYVDQVELNLAINPSLTPHLIPVERLSDAEKQALLDEVRAEDKTLTLTILQSLFRAEALSNVAKFDDFEFMRLEIEVAVIPAVKLSYFRKTPLPESANIETNLPTIKDA